MARTIGLKDVSFALLKSDTGSGATYDTVKKYERAVNAKITPKSNSEKTFSDDTVEDITSLISQVDVEIELNQLSNATRAFIQGSKIVNGVLVENKDDIAPFVAMVFKSKKTDGSYRYVCLLKGKFEISADDYATQEEKIKTQTAKLKGTFVCREYDGNYRFIADSNDTGVVVADLEKWFTTVPTVPVTATP